VVGAVVGCICAVLAVVGLAAARRRSQRQQNFELGEAPTLPVHASSSSSAAAATAAVSHACLSPSYSEVGEVNGGFYAYSYEYVKDNAAQGGVYGQAMATTVGGSQNAMYEEAEEKVEEGHYHNATSDSEYSHNYCHADEDAVYHMITSSEPSMMGNTEYDEPSVMLSNYNNNNNNNNNVSEEATYDNTYDMAAPKAESNYDMASPKTEPHLVCNGVGSPESDYDFAAPISVVNATAKEEGEDATYCIATSHGYDLAEPVDTQDRDQ